MYALTQTVAPTQEPLRLADAKKHLRLTHDEDDRYIATTLIPAVREYFEGRTSRQLITATWELRLDCFPAGRIVLPKAPTASVSSLKYLDAAGTEQTWAASNYDVQTTSEPAEISLAFGKTWPTTRQVPHAVRITYISGYGATSADVPHAMRVAMLLLLQHWYENRSGVVVGTISTEIPLAVGSLIDHARVGDEFTDYVRGA